MYDRNETIWGSADGKETLIKDLHTAHLVNILNWIKTNNSTYSDDLFHFFEEEAKYRRTVNFCLGKEIPFKQGDGFYIVTNQTLINRAKSLFYKKRSHIIMHCMKNKNFVNSLIYKVIKPKVKVDL